MNSFQKIHSQLPGFIEELRLSGFKVGVGEQLSIQRLLLTLRAQKALPEDPSDLALYIGPIVCSSLNEQTQFLRLYQGWVESLELEPGTAPTASTSSSPTTVPTSGRQRLLVIAILFSIVVGASYHVYLQLRPSAEPAAHASPGDPGKAREIPISITPTATPESDSVTKSGRQAVQTDWYGVFFLTLALAISYLLWRRWRLEDAKNFLQRRSSSGSQKTHRLLVSPKGKIIDSTALLRTSQKFRSYLKIETRSLDPERTIVRTLESSGLFSPVYRTRSALPEYLALVSCRSARDHQAALTFTLIDELVAQGLYVDTYTYSEDPRLCWSTKERADWVSVKELQSRHPHHKLWVFSDDGLELLPPRGVRNDEWSEFFEAWEERTLFTYSSTAENQTFDDERLRLGFVVQALEHSDFSQGLYPVLEESVEQFPEPIPELFEDDDWLSGIEVAPRALEDGLQELRQHLGEQGFLLLSASAFYPEIDWKLTLELAGRLAYQAEKIDTQLLSRVLRLPWFREGFMPDWLRVELIDGLATSDKNAIRDILDDLLTKTLSREGIGAALEIAELKKRGLWRDILTQLGLQEDEGPAQERVFLSSLCGVGAFSLPQRVGRFLRRAFRQSDGNSKRLDPPRTIKASLLLACVVGAISGIGANFELVWLASAWYFYLVLAGLSELVNPAHKKRRFMIEVAGTLVTYLISSRLLGTPTDRTESGALHMLYEPVLWNWYPNPILLASTALFFRFLQNCRSRDTALWQDVERIAVYVDRMLRGSTGNPWERVPIPPLWASAILSTVLLAFFIRVDESPLQGTGPWLIIPWSFALFATSRFAAARGKPKSTFLISGFLLLPYFAQIAETESSRDLSAFVVVLLLGVLFFAWMPLRVTDGIRALMGNFFSLTLGRLLVAPAPEWALVSSQPLGEPIASYTQNKEPIRGGIQIAANLILGLSIYVSAGTYSFFAVLALQAVYFARSTNLRAPRNISYTWLICSSSGGYLLGMVLAPDALVTRLQPGPGLLLVLSSILVSVLWSMNLCTGLMRLLPDNLMLRETFRKSRQQPFSRAWIARVGSIAVISGLLLNSTHIGLAIWVGLLVFISEAHSRPQRPFINLLPQFTMIALSLGDWKSLGLAHRLLMSLADGVLLSLLGVAVITINDLLNGRPVMELRSLYLFYESLFPKSVQFRAWTLRLLNREIHLFPTAKFYKKK